MRRLVIVLAVMGAMLAMSAGAAMPQAFTETFAHTEPFASSVPNPCNGDLIPITGHITFVGHETETPNERTEVFLSHANLQGSGTGLLAGDKYTVNESVTVNQVIAEATTSTLTFHSNIIGEGQVPDFRQRFRAHFTINANGEVTAEVFFLDAECKG